jgi:DUF4097 and DUF4098 domain-containing protein YvlB
MRHLIFAALLLAPAAAMAADEPQCKFHADRNLDLDLAGVQTIEFVTNSHDLKIDGAAGGKPGVHGRACASTQEMADSLVVEQSKNGSTLVVELKDTHKGGWHIFGSSYSYLKVNASVPGNLPIKVDVGSGDADVRNVASLEASAGSGDLDVDGVKGGVTANVGSGDVKLANTGPVKIDSVGSGDLTARNVTGGVTIGTVGSGDAKLRDISGNVDVGTIGSGDLDVDGVKGNLTVRTAGSGDVDHKGVTGKVDLPKKFD